MRSLKHVITTFVLIALAAARPLSVRFRETTGPLSIIGPSGASRAGKKSRTNELNKDADIQVLGVNLIARQATRWQLTQKP